MRRARVVKKRHTQQQFKTFIAVDTSGGAWTLTLLPAATAYRKPLIIKKTDVSANALTIQANAAETIDVVNINPDIDAQYDMLWLLSDGTHTRIT